MDKSHFWRLVEASRTTADRECERQVEAITRLLAALQPEEIIEYWNIYVGLTDLAYRDDLYTAANLINGSGSTDGFMDFGSWLIAQGREVYERAIQDPDTLAAVELAEGEDAECEQFGYVALVAYELRTGREMEIPERSDKDWDIDFLTDEDAKARMPNLWNKYMEE